MSEFDDVEILLVEDNPYDAEMTMRALRKNHLTNKLHWVKDGVEALEFVRATGPYAERDAQRLPKLMLLDLKMPRLDGFDVLGELKGDERTRALPIVAMTSSNQPADLERAYRLGVNGYVTKPVQFADLMEAVARIGMYWVMLNQVPEP
jgi:two-component system response regulator